MTTTRLSDLMNLADLEAEVAAGFVNRRLHPDAPLAILNYGPSTQYERRWNDVTRQTRGLIYNTETLEVVARPWKKFGNWDESGYPYPPVGPMIMAPKFDGSLGILYFNEANSEWSIATRGSFTSDQALHATKRLGEILLPLSEDEWTQLLEQWSDPNLTFLFEIIYPENRIVVNYAGGDRLVLLDVIDNSTGLQRLDVFDSLYWDDKSPKVLVPEGFAHSLVEKIPSGEEGFVLSWPTRGFMCKMKSAEYVELHRIVTGLSKKSVWEAMGRGAVSELRENVPDELYEWFDSTVAEFHDRISTILDQAYEDFDRAVIKSHIPPASPPDIYANVRERRAEFARTASQFRETSAYIFKILDNADDGVLWNMAWKTVKPVGDSRVWNASEDVA
jgi:RNA ligase